MRQTLHQPAMMRHGVSLWLACMACCTTAAQAQVLATQPLPEVQAKQRAWGAKLGKPARLLVGLDSQDDDVIAAQSLRIDIYDRYINHVGADNSWVQWNKPNGAYIKVVAKAAQRVGAVPMYTLYQMATLGDGNLSGLKDSAFMTQYWSQVRLMYQQLGELKQPALVHFEPDFWGYAQRKSPDPSGLLVHVSNVNPDCANQPNNMVGMAQCLVQMARQAAPKVLVGFAPSLFGDLIDRELAYFQQLGAQHADFVVMQTSDRDAGCFEARFVDHDGDAACTRTLPHGFWWDETNTKTPNFHQQFKWSSHFSNGLKLPVVWWQTPMGAPAPQAGGKAGAFRDNRVQYFLTHTAELVQSGAVAVLFGPGHTSQTQLQTDGGQFKRLYQRYLDKPTTFIQSAP